MKIILVAFFSTISSVVLGQYQAEEFQAALLEAKYGALLVYNGKSNSFSLKFESKNFKPTEKANFVLIDGVLMQSSLIPFQEEIDFKKMDRMLQRKYLLAWKEYEKNWVEEQLKTKLTDKDIFVDLANRAFIYWSYNMPKVKSGSNVEKQVYLVGICFDQLLVLNGPVEKGKTEELVKTKLLTVAKTLMLYPGKVQDLEKLYNDLKK
ncbi:MAG: hypothetical protein QM734_07115 [Cyclobacteriaceae bacterium]